MKVLLATDGSGFTRSSIELLDRLHFPDGSELSILTVVPDVESVTGGHRSTADDDVQRAARDEAERSLQRAATETSRLGVAVSRTVRTGNATDEIIRYGLEIGTEVAVVGSHGHRGFKRFLLGSVAVNVVTYAPFSVVIVRPGDEGEPSGDAPLRVLIATDGSAQSDAAIEQFTELTGDRWCTIRMVTVLEVVTAYRMDIRQRLSESWGRRKADAEAHLRKAVETVSPLAVEVETQVIEASSASKAILDSADEFRAEMILIGGTGKGRVERVLLGSVASRIARHARCSVWVAR